MYGSMYKSKVITKKNIMFIFYHLLCIVVRIISYVTIASGVKKLVICLAARILLVITFRLQ